ncbi:MAG TPA: response regulator [Fibrobacter sp.]|nr:response regulator [Fibrobacter sp.]
MTKERLKILVVDDTKSNIEVLEGILSSEYDVYVALNGEKALELVPKINPDIILLDIMMPVMDGYETLVKMKERQMIDNIPVIFLTAKMDSKSEETGLNLGAVDYITKPFSPSLMRLRIKNQLEFKKHRDSLSELVEERTDSLKKTLKVMLMSLGSLAEYRDNETGGHIRRTQFLVHRLAEVLHKNPKYQKELPNQEVIEHYATAAPLHDIGKVGIHDDILRKPSRLTDDEMEQMKTHTTLGYEVLLSATKELKNDPMVVVAADIAKAHHEKWDGTGYPNGLKGEEIPLGARLMAVADVYDALVSKRVYKAAYPHHTAVEIILDGKGKHFDPDVIDAFLTIADEVPAFYEDFKD